MKNEKNYLEFKNTENLNLSETFDCGQCFRWEPLDDGYTGIVGGKKLKATLKDNSLILNFPCDYGERDYWERYFDLTLNYGKILEKLKSLNPVLSKACESYSGIRILNQEPWEALCSFIISQNNNIPRIKGIISRLCENFGETVEGGYSFPSAEKISKLSEEDLKPIRCGFRASYILDAARKVSDGEIMFDYLRNTDMDEARQILMKIKGVGPKVAECTLLYGLHRLEAFPMDVWMKRIMSKLFKNETPDMFGEFAGIAQQYLYHYVRSNPYVLED